jgi:lipopolysaccharide/colanic/teichoic acid biosynthesis glycosyltransferase
MLYNLVTSSRWARDLSVHVDGSPTKMGQEAYVETFTPKSQRLLDLAISIPLVMTIFPVLILLSVVIKFDSHGPILFRQPRIGLGNRIFLIYKFRSMHSSQLDLECKQQTMVNDVRVTRVGRFVRALSLDELPQLFNVLRGEMSLVGPRPHAAGTAVDGVLLSDLVPDYHTRHSMRPGITGWAQVNGSRGALLSQSQVVNRYELDMYFIRNWSVGRYAVVLLRTTLQVLSGARAY